MVVGYFLWWYSEGFIQAWRTLQLFLFRLFDFFSLDLLAKSWLAPWRNDTASAANISLSQQMKLWQWNFVSRFVGFVMRSFVILIGLTLLVAISAAGLIGLGVWLLTPVLVVVLPFLAGILAFYS